MEHQTNAKKGIRAVAERVWRFAGRAVNAEWVWFGILPVLIACGYWMWFHALAFTDGSAWRIPALPKVFFDQSMYVQVIAKDLLHGFHILPLHLRPFEWIARGMWPGVSLSEMYVVGIITSALVSLWIMARVIESTGDLSRGAARVATIASFLLAQAILVLRPGAPSWYVPFFFLAFLCAWKGERAFVQRSTLLGIGWWALALVLSAAYPWYFATIVSVCGLLFLCRVIRPRLVPLILGGGLLIAGGVFFARDLFVPALLSSPSVILAYYVGIQFSHLTTLSNTVLLMFAWWVLWLFTVRHDVRTGSASVSTSRFFLAVWTGQLILWFQSVFTGFSLIPDHFIYTVWLVSALGWIVAHRSSEKLARHERIVRMALGLIAIVYVTSVVVRIGMGMFAWTAYPSLVIHAAAWMFLALAALPLPRKMILTTALIVGVASAALGVTAVTVSARDRVATDKDVDGVRTWIMETRPSAELRWCSDTLASDFLFATTGETFYPTFSDKHETVSLTQLQNRLIELSAFFNPKNAKELHIWDDMILHDADFPCRAFVPGIALMSHVPFSDATKRFITGCDQSWADTERARVIAAMDARWERDVPQDSALCDRFVTRRSLWDSWRVPTSYELLYKDDTAAVWGKH